MGGGGERRRAQLGLHCFAVTAASPSLVGQYCCCVARFWSWREMRSILDHLGRGRCLGQAGGSRAMVTDSVVAVVSPHPLFLVSLCPVWCAIRPRHCVPRWPITMRPGLALSTHELLYPTRAPRFKTRSRLFFRAARCSFRSYISDVRTTAQKRYSSFLLYPPGAHPFVRNFCGGCVSARTMPVRKQVYNDNYTRIKNSLGSRVAPMGGNIANLAVKFSGTSADRASALLRKFQVRGGIFFFHLD